VKSAPRLAGEHLDPAEEDELRRHYGVAEPGTTEPGIGEPEIPEPGREEHTREPVAGGPGWLPPVPPPADRHERDDLHDGGSDRPPSDDRPADDLANTAVMAAPTQEIPVIPPPPAAEAEHGTAPADGSMTRSEERLQVGTERVSTTRARLVKYVVTEEVQITVPIRREEIRVEEVPLDAPDPGPGESLTDGREVSESRLAAGASERVDGLPDEIVLHTERPVVSVEVVPVERVRLRTETVEGQERITEQVQREQIVVDETPSPRLSPR
jgi:stress response protein YsnF